MKFYLCHTPEGRKRLVTRQDEAKKIDKGAEQIDIPVDQAGIKAGYEELFDRIFDLEQTAQNSHDPDAPTVADGLEPEGMHHHSHDTRHLSESYTDKSVRFDEEFDQMPLAQQLHYASKAMENARERLD